MIYGIIENSRVLMRKTAQNCGMKVLCDAIAVLRGEGVRITKKQSLQGRRLSPSHFFH